VAEMFEERLKDGCRSLRALWGRLSLYRVVATVIFGCVVGFAGIDSASGGVMGQQDMPAPSPQTPGNKASMIFTTHDVTIGACQAICEHVLFCAEVADFDINTAACQLRLQTAHPAFKKLARACPGALRGVLREEFVKGPANPQTGVEGRWTIICGR